MRMYVCVNVSMHVWMHVCVYGCTYVCMDARMCVWMHVCVYGCMYACMCALLFMSVLTHFSLYRVLRPKSHSLAHRLLSYHGLLSVGVCVVVQYSMKRHSRVKIL
jgi:hypothetical protein